MLQILAVRSDGEPFRAFHQKAGDGVNSVHGRGFVGTAPDELENALIHEVRHGQHAAGCDGVKRSACAAFKKHSAVHDQKNAGGRDAILFHDVKSVGIGFFFLGVAEAVIGGWLVMELQMGELMQQQERVGGSAKLHGGIHDFRIGQCIFRDVQGF